MKYDVIIIGAGAAGLMCAIEAGRRGRRVAVIEHNDAVGKKIAISGGGRCNFTNTHTTPDNFLSGNANFCRSALARYTPDHFIELVRKHGVRHHHKKHGQLFCDGSARAIIDLLLRECADAQVEIHTGLRATDVQKPGAFLLTTAQGSFTCDSLVVASGGLSMPRIGASDFGHRLAQRFGIGVTPCRPALVPLLFDDATDVAGLRDLAGLSFEAEVAGANHRFRDSVLLTHRGLSGPAILQVSLYWQPGNDITLDILPGMAAAADLSPHSLPDLLPRRLAARWCELYAPRRPFAQASQREIEAFRLRLRQWVLRPSGTEGYGKAEVTAGGVDTHELSSKTMESRKVPGLYFIGEVVDVTGQLGGFNFQWAWASGFAAGQSV